MPQDHLHQHMPHGNQEINIMNIAQDRLGLRKRMVGAPTVIGDPSGRMSGLAVTEGGRGFQVHESPRTTLDTSGFGMSPQLDDRNKFKEFLYNKYELSGKRPASESEIISRIMSESQAKEAALSQHVFGERGRETGNKEHDVIWNKALTQMRNNIKTRIMGEVSGQKEDYDHKKSMIDEELKVYDSYVGKEKGKRPKLPTTKNVVDYLKGRRYEDLDRNEQLVVDEMLAPGGTGLELETENVPPERSGWLDFGEPNIPATTRRSLVPKGQGEQGLGARPQQGIRQPVRQPISPNRRQRTGAKESMGMADNQIAEILKQNGFAITPENIARFKAQN